MDQKKKKRINKFAIIILLLIIVPEAVGHTIFDRSHPASSSVNAAVALTNKLDNGYPINDFGCHLVMHNDTTSSNITRAAGMAGQYGKYDCGINQKN